MSDAAHTASREEEMLARLAELDLAAAEKAHARLMAAEDASEIAEMGRTYQRMSRSLRQTLALKAKLAREREIHRIRTTPMALTPRRAPAPRLTPAVRAHIDAAAAVALKYLEREREVADYDPIGEIEIYEILEELADDEAFLDTAVEDLADQVFAIIDRIFADIPDEPAAPANPPAPEPPIHDSA